MASTGKCPFCGAVETSDQKQCPECGAENPHYIEDRPQRVLKPETIDELKEYCAERGMPLLRMRFFIGEDTKEPRAFGICRDGDRFLVYKNKADGSRAVRYNGPDEAYAVREIYNKLLDECRARGINPDGTSAAKGTRSMSDASRSFSRSPVRKATHGKSGSAKPLFLFIGVFLLVLIFMKIAGNREIQPLKNGYYRDKYATLYYYEDQYSNSYSDWHAYDEGWKKARMPFADNGDALGNYLGETYKTEYGGEALAFPSVQEGYYLADGTLYCYDGAWHSFDEANQNWNGNQKLQYDADDTLLDPQDYYLGQVYLTKWPGCEYPLVQGYYLYKEELWYYSRLTEHWYHLEGDRWEKSSWPMNAFSNFYEGDTYQAAWGGKANPLSGPTKAGYYRSGERIWYYDRDGKAWYEYIRRIQPSETTRKLIEDIPSLADFYTKGTWTKVTVFTEPETEQMLLTADECYLGTECRKAAWSIQPFAKNGYYRYGLQTYYHKDGNWYQYVSRKWITAGSLPDNPIDYFVGNYVLSSWNVPSYYQSYSTGGGSYGSSSYDWDSGSDSSSGSSSSWGSDWGSDWGSSSDWDSWDSSGSDWDSDW